MTSKAHVTVLMSTYDGENFLRDQIESILNQEDVYVHLIVRDDGSKDRTINILEEYQSRGKLEWYSGKNLGSARSFLNLVSKSPDNEYYAFSDQDDVWFSKKLKRAIGYFESSNDTNLPILYAGNYILVDKDLNKINKSLRHVTTTTLANAIVYSCCTGCTMVFNKKLRDLIKKYNAPETIYMHDDWIHKVCLAVGGKVIYDSHPMMFYRQHENNVDGGTHTFWSKVNRIKLDKNLMSGQIKEIYKAYNKNIPINNKKIIEKALILGKGNLLKRLRLAFSSQYKIRSNTKLNNEFRLLLLLDRW
ncbi:glycosyltransferase family 2 protein [Limosilactobacillus reuteri subsp. suis]|uniref:glycosyltransferase family 2 protein n=1 Tax=Limosilactobacillus reuteri TaxID=1598 RepID=UPI0039948177